MKRAARVLSEVVPLLILGAVVLWLRWPALHNPGFHNEDAAGITYSADLLRHGGLPLVDTVEAKEPGSFFLLWGVWGAFGRSLPVANGLAVAWSLLAMLGVWLGGRLLYGRAAGLAAALVYAVCAPVTDSIDINYNGWMMAPYAAAAALLIGGLKRGGLGWIVACGATLAVTGLCKRQGALVFPVFVALLALSPRLRAPEGWTPPAPRRALPAFAGGLALGFAPIMAFYAAHGALGEFVSQYFFSRSGWRYAAAQIAWDERVVRFGDGLLGLWEFTALPVLLAALTIAAITPGGRPGLRGWLLAGHLAASFAGAAVGFRFYKGYYVQLLPALAWLAAHPRGPLLRWFDGASWPRPRLARVGLALGLAAAVTPVAVAHGRDVAAIRRDRARPRDGAAQAVARVIRAHTKPDDRIWVWGRWGWPAYFHADRRSATRFYKNLAVLTTNLTNTWRRPTERTRFDPESPWQAAMQDLEGGRPAFIVVALNEDYREFKAFRGLLQREYQLVPRVGAPSLQLYRRKDIAVKEPPKRAPKKPVAKKPAAPPPPPKAPAAPP